MGKTVLITAIGSFAAEAVITSCRSQGFRVVGCDIYPAEWVVNSREVDAFYQAPCAADRAAWRTFLAEVCRREQADLVMPLIDGEVDALLDWPEAAGELGALVCMCSRDTGLVCRNKARLGQFLEQKKVCRVIPGRLLSEVLKDGAGRNYPLVLKPIDGRSSQGLRMVDNAREFSQAARMLEDLADRYLVQEKIPGMVVTVDVVRQPDTGACVCLPRRELLRTPNGAGTTVQVFRNTELEARCQAVAGALDIRGCVNFEFIEHGCTGEWYFLECNPRFSGGLPFSVLAGYDMVKNHVNCFTNRDLEPLEVTGSHCFARRYMEYRMDGTVTYAGGNP